MRCTYIVLIACTVLQMMAQITPPSGEYCGTFTSDVFDLQLTVTGNTGNTFDISGTLSLAGGDPNSAEETDIPYEFNSATGTITVTDLDKIQDFLNELGAPISSGALGTFNYDGTALSSSALDDFELTNAGCASRRSLRA
ncbi:hypothetical protein FOL47_008110 [Perkinsus chesapeaki]|uniref:Uncharacterized protein n=1 Tax=Perkinsus chesapeaki TaxID=330153 RepID=A0A7J6LGW8_PERCH|nr:hypothetical protein FOL47_008110 [Perkinsus chesapeaki]